MNLDYQLKLHITSFISKFPFYSGLLLGMKRNLTKETRYASVSVAGGRVRLHINPALFEKSSDLVTLILLHETMHVVLDHFFRRNGRDAAKWNIACDLAINSMIRRMHSYHSKDIPDIVAEFPGGCHPSTFHKTPLPENKSAEQYYDLLQARGDFEIDGMGNSYIVNPDGTKTKTGELVHTPKLFDDSGDDSPDGDFLNKQIVKELIQDAIMDSSEIPVEVRSSIQEILGKPSVPWNKLLRGYVAASINVSRISTWRKSNRRGCDLQKGKLPFRKLKLVFAYDTSGSCYSDDVFQMFLKEVKAIMASYKSSVTVIECDTRIRKVFELTPHTEVKTDLIGGGGTSFIPVFEYIEQNKLKPDLLIYFTDCYGSYPEKPPKYGVIWAAVSDPKMLGSYAPYFGRIVHVRKK